MAQSNQEHIGRALELLNKGLHPFVLREMQATCKEKWLDEIRKSLRVQHLAGGTMPHLDTQALLLILWDQWESVFCSVLGSRERTIIRELRNIRNKWAHQKPFSTADVYSALESIQRLLTAISARQEAQEIEQQKQDVLGIPVKQQTVSGIGTVTAAPQQQHVSALQQHIATVPSVLGKDSTSGALVTIEQEQRLKGLYVIGKTGSGKTTLLVNLILQDIEQGMGVCFFDTHGSPFA